MNRDPSSALAGPLIPAAVIRVLQEHTLASYPAECCGLVFAEGHGAAATRALRMENLQDRLHILDPESHPRTSRDGFQMNALHMLEEVAAAVARGERLLAIFHSHIDCDATFSQEDLDMAAPPPDRTPTYPDVWHLILACWPDGIREARAYRWDGTVYAGAVLSGFSRSPLPHLS